MKPENERGKSKEMDLICSDCGSHNVKTKEEEYSFEYGVDDERVELKAIVPIRICSDCGHSFLDCEAEDKCHDAVCKYKGVMTPSEIMEIRKSYGLTQAEFCKITKLGDATLSRWERGALIQNAAYDYYLYLLKYPLNFEKIRKYNEGETEKVQEPQNRFEKFRVLDPNERDIERSKTFKLHLITEEGIAQCM
jgi:putative zinc finger/helix-turn-helix YgiT family protein